MDFDDEEVTPHRSGASEAGGATTVHSMFGGSNWSARMWRFLARVARDLESTAYRRLKELEESSQDGTAHPGAPRRTKRALHDLRQS